MIYLCENCLHIGESAESSTRMKIAKWFIYVMTFLGIVISIFEPLAFIFVIPWIAIVVVIMLMLRNHKYSACASCHDRTLIPIDSPKAKILIEENNLIVPEVVPKQSKLPWQSS